MIKIALWRFSEEEKVNGIFEKLPSTELYLKKVGAILLDINITFRYINRLYVSK